MPNGSQKYEENTVGNNTVNKLCLSLSSRGEVRSG